MYSSGFSCIQMLTDVCRSISFENSFERLEPADGQPEKCKLKLIWKGNESMVMTHSDKQVYFTKEELDRRAEEARIAEERLKEREAAEQRKKEVAEFVGILNEELKKHPEDSVSRKVFNEILMKSFEYPTDENVTLVNALKKFIMWNVEGINMNGRVEFLLVMIDRGLTFYMYDNVKADNVVAINLIRFFTKSGFNAMARPLMEVLDGTEPDDVLKRVINQSHDIQFDPK